MNRLYSVEHIVGPILNRNVETMKTGGKCMTLLINEIHAIGSLQNSFILNVADRRLTDKDTGKWHGNHKKIFQIPYLRSVFTCVYGRLSNKISK
jgi:hypothetical protein